MMPGMYKCYTNIGYFCYYFLNILELGNLLFLIYLVFLDSYINIEIT